jgi:hypothetical protein
MDAVMDEPKIKKLEADLEVANAKLLHQAGIIEEMRRKGAQDATELKEARDSVLDLSRENARLHSQNQKRQAKKAHVFYTHSEEGRMEVGPRAVNGYVEVRRFKVTVEYEEDLEAEREKLIGLWKRNGRNMHLLRPFHEECKRLGIDPDDLPEPDRGY